MAGSESPQKSKVPLERDDQGRPRFHGCSSIREYDFLGKLGEGTFGYAPWSGASTESVLTLITLQRGLQGSLETDERAGRDEEDFDTQ